MSPASPTLLRRAHGSWCRRPLAWLAATLAITVVSLPFAAELGLDTDLIRLLPGHSRASVETRALDGVVGGSSYFAVIVEGSDPDALRGAVEEIAGAARTLPGVASVEYRHPVDFIERYRYLLLSSYYLDRLQDEVLDWEAEVNPFVDDLGGGSSDSEDYGRREDRKELESRLTRYGDLPEYHVSADGRLMGVFVRPARGATSLGATRELFARLQEVAASAVRGPGVDWSGVSGSMRNKIDEYDVIVGDLSRAGTVSGLAIVFLLLAVTRSASATLLSVSTLLVGQLWGFSLVPTLVGELNTITAFLLVVVFGMGIDFAIHLVARFRQELSECDADEALWRTYDSTGRAVAASGITTAFALLILAFSDFRGFSEFGLVGGVALLAVLAAMYVMLPAAMLLAARHGLLRPSAGSIGSFAPLPPRAAGLALALLVLVAGGFAVRALAFDYDFRNLRADVTVPEAVEAKERQRQVYTTTQSPAAVYMAEDLDSLDRLLAVLESARDQGGALGRVASIRDLLPTAAEEERRRDLLGELQEMLGGSWTRRIEDPRRRRWVDDLLEWRAPRVGPAPDSIPGRLVSGLFAQDGSGRPLAAVYPSVERSDGRNAMDFTTALYRLELPEGVRGPVGETPVFAEILWLVLGEGPWLIGGALLGVFLLLTVSERSPLRTIWILLPLVAGMMLTFGIMALFDIRLNFFNMVVLPALIGLGVDDGVHYYRRWRELGGQTRATSRELFVPLTLTSVTTILGYSGMLFAHHPGLRSIGIAACLGLGLVWLTSLFLLPPLLEAFHPAPVARDPR